MSTPTVFNLEDALARVDEDEELFQTLAELFVEQAPHDFAAAAAALKAGDAKAVAQAAHRLKGALVQFSAPRVLEATKELETLGKTGSLQSAATVCHRVEQELQALIEALRAYLTRGSAS
ncbi:MAG: Hpt domain-containing protein [Nitrospira sp.]